MYTLCYSGVEIISKKKQDRKCNSNNKGYKQISNVFSR